jgi:hypothetical protein
MQWGVKKQSKSFTYGVDRLLVGDFNAFALPHIPNLKKDLIFFVSLPPN